MDFSTVYCKSEQFVEKSIGDEKVLVPLTDNVADMNQVFTLNEVASFIFDQIDGERSLKDICDNLVEEYEVAKDVATNDIIHFIGLSVDKGVLFTKQ